MPMFELLVSVHAPGAGLWTDCVLLSASSLDDAKLQASQTAAKILQISPGDARMQSDDGQIV